MEKILNEHKIVDLKPGDILYQVELTSEDGQIQLTPHKLIFDKYLEKNVKIPDIEMSKDSLLAQLHSEKAPKIPIKTDISCGYFLSEKEASWEFVNMTKILYKRALSDYESKFGKFTTKQI
jgi:hypothetical protein